MSLGLGKCWLGLGPESNSGRLVQPRQFCQKYIVQVTERERERERGGERERERNYEEGVCGCV